MLGMIHRVFKLELHLQQRVKALVDAAKLHSEGDSDNDQSASSDKPTVRLPDTDANEGHSQNQIGGTTSEIPAGPPETFLPALKIAEDQACNNLLLLV